MTWNDLIVGLFSTDPPNAPTNTFDIDILSTGIHIYELLFCGQKIPVCVPVAEP